MVTRMLVSYDQKPAMPNSLNELHGHQNVGELRPPGTGADAPDGNCKVTRMLVNYAFLFSSFFIARTNVLIIIYVK